GIYSTRRRRAAESYIPPIFSLSCFLRILSGSPLLCVKILTNAKLPLRQKATTSQQLLHLLAIARVDPRNTEHDQTERDERKDTVHSFEIAQVIHEKFQNARKQ